MSENEHKLEAFAQNNSSNGNDTNGKKRKKVSVACVYCRRSHMNCDDKRPCTRCIKRNISHLCHDEPISTRQKKAKGDQDPAALQFNKVNELASPELNTVNKETNMGQQTSSFNDSLNNLYSTFADSNTSGDGNSNNANNKNVSSSIPLLSQLHPFTNQTNPFFFSEHANSEFSSLNEFLSMIDDPDIVKGLSASNSYTDLKNLNNNNGNKSQNYSLFDANQPTNINANFGSFNVATGDFGNMTNVTDIVHPRDGTKTQSSLLSNSVTNGGSATASVGLPASNSEPVISDSARDKFFLTAADPSTEISPEERLKQVIKAKLDAGLLQPYNYAKGYQRLQNYMDNYMNQQSRQRILKPLSVFRPGFRAIAGTLKDVDLVLVEEAFERMLLDYDRVFTSMAIPACLWRRTGEIYRGNKEFAQLVEVGADSLKDGKLTIYELMSEESAVNFWEKYGAIAFDKSQKAVLTSCNLRTKDGRKRKNCCFSFTIRRDRYNIPSCIVGNFIPLD